MVPETSSERGSTRLRIKKTADGDTDTPEAATLPPPRYPWSRERSGVHTRMPYRSRRDDGDKEGDNRKRQAGAEVLCAPVFQVPAYLGLCHRQTGAEKVPAVPELPTNACRCWDESCNPTGGSTPPSQAPLPKTLRLLPPPAPSQARQKQPLCPLPLGNGCHLPRDPGPAAAPAHALCPQWQGVPGAHM